METDMNNDVGMMLKDPELYTVKEKMTVQMWPPSIDNVADSMMPYVNRMAAPVRILIVGTFNGEAAYRFLELDEKKKIGEIVSLSITDDEIPFNITAERNLQGKDVVLGTSIPETELFDLVFVNSETKIPLDSLYEKYYNNVKVGGIICGNDHHKEKVREYLAVFMKEKKLGLSLNISNRTVWFLYKHARRG